jgi:hypothetical protein
MPTKKSTKSASGKKPMRDLKPSKDAKGGGRHAEVGHGRKNPDTLRKGLS